MQLEFKLQCRKEDHIWSHWHECHVSTLANGRNYLSLTNSEIVTVSTCLICKDEKILVEKGYGKRESIFMRLWKSIG